MNKNIFFLNTCKDWGGGEKWTFETAEALNDRGHNVIVGSIPKSDLYKKSQKTGIKTKKVLVKGSLTSLNLFKMNSFIGYLKKKEIDILFLNLSQDLKFGGIAGHRAGVEKIIYRRGSAIPIKNRFYTKYLLEDCVTDIIANSKSTKRTILMNTSNWLTEDKIKIIYNGLKIDKIKNKIKKEHLDIRKEFNINSDDIIISNVGRLSPQKGHKYLLKAIKLIKNNIKNFKVLIVGKGELEDKIKNQAKKLQVMDKVIFTGFRTDVYNILSQSDFLLHTALWEGFGYVIAEAMAVGLPVVSTDVSNISEIMKEDITGYLAESKNPKDIAKKTIKMCNKNKKEMEKMGKKGKKIIEENFIFEKMVNDIEKLIQ